MEDQAYKMEGGTAMGRNGHGEKRPWGGTAMRRNSREERPERKKGREGGRAGREEGPKRRHPHIHDVLFTNTAPKSALPATRPRQSDVLTAVA
jgi:hypothetical protein